MDGNNLFGPGLLPSPMNSSSSSGLPPHLPQVHRRSVTFDAMDLSHMASMLDSMSSSPTAAAAAAVAPSPLPPASYSAAPPLPAVALTSDAMQAQLALQQSLIIQQQQWLYAMQQQQLQQQQPPSLYYHGYAAAARPPPSPSSASFHRHVYAPAPAPAPPPSNTAASLLVEYKQTGMRPTVPALVASGAVLCFALDSHGSRFLQYQMEVCSREDKELLVRSTLDQDSQDNDAVVQLMRDTFGNYVMQNFFSHSLPGTRVLLAQRMRGHMLSLTIDPHGCRVVQRMLDVVDASTRNALLGELVSGARHNVFTAARNTHGTHVLQKTVSMLRRDGNSSRALLGQLEQQIALDVVALLLHPNSYRLVLNVLGDCDRHARPNLAPALDAVLASQLELSKDQHGNFILQHLLEVPQESQRVMDFVLSSVFDLSRHKFASHLVEKCLAVAGDQQCGRMVEELLRPREHVQHSILELMTDPYANFVVQKAFDRLSPQQQELKQEMVNVVQANADMLGRFTYGRHILGHIVNAAPQQQNAAASPPALPHHQHRGNHHHQQARGRHHHHHQQQQQRQ